jgi:hypothetical protein
MRSAARALALIALLAAASGCRSDGGGGGSDSAPPVAAPPPAPPPPAVANYDVDPCLVQLVQPGQSVAILVVPDTLSLDFSRPASFPNGRKLEDPVVDRTLAMIFLDLTSQSIDTLHNLPLNPPVNDKPFRTDFPWLAPPFGAQPVAQGGSGFNFRTDPASTYVRVDRMGMPAIATALISSSHKNEYNDDSPREDATFKWVPEIRGSLTQLTNALADDFTRLNLKLCARPKT